MGYALVGSPGAVGEFFGWDPLPSSCFVPALKTLALLRPKGRFVDVGCGVGTKLLRAKRAGFEVTGLELNRRYAEIAQRFVPEAEIVVGNAFEWSGYGEFDVVYSYRLCVEEQAQRALEAWVFPQVAPDAILFWPFRREPFDHGWRLIQEHLWRRA